MSRSAHVKSDIAKAISRSIKIMRKNRPDILESYKNQTENNIHLPLYTLEELTYRAYNTDFQFKHYLDDIYELEFKEQYKKQLDVETKDYEKQFKKITKLVDKNDKFLFLSLHGGYWLNVYLTSAISKDRDKKMYINFDPQHIYEIIKNLIHIMIKYRNDLIAQFKIPQNLTSSNAGKKLYRTDKLVIYYKSGFTEEILKNWARKNKKLFRKSTPLFAKKEIPGVATTKELTKKQKKYAESKGIAKSFGGFISRILADELDSFFKKNKRFPNIIEIHLLARKIFNEELTKKHGFDFR